MARYKLNNLVDRVKQKMSGIPQTLSNIGQKLTDDEGLFQRGRFTMPQREISPLPQYSQPTQTFGYKANNVKRAILRPLAGIQNAIESPKPVQLPTLQAPKLQNPVSNAVVGAGVGLANIGLNVADSIVSKGIVNPTLDVINTTVRTLGGRDIVPYQNLRSSQGRLGYNIAGYNRNPQQIIGNTAGSVMPVLDAYGGGKVFGLGKKAIIDVGNQAAKQSFKNIVLRGAKEGAKYGAIGGGLQGLSDARDAENLFKQLYEGVKGTVIGAGAGAAFGGAVSGAGYIVGKQLSRLIGTYKASNPNSTNEEATQAIRKYIRDELGQFAKGPKKNKPEPAFYGDFRESLGLPRDGRYDRGFAVMDEPIKIGKDKPQQINTGAYTAIDPKTGKIKIQDPKQTLRTLMGGTDNPRMSNAQTRATLGDKADPFIQELEQMKSQPIRNTTIPPKAPKGNQRPSPDVVNEMEQISKNNDITRKVNLIDYLRTPENVLKKMGLEGNAKEIRSAYDSYQKDVRNEIDRVTQWQKQVPDQESARSIFQYLDGQSVKLTPQEQKVANEIRSYLSQWADKLGLPEDKRIASYITHIFDKDFIEKEFDPEIAKIIQDRVPGSVYDPFLQKRLGKQGYKEDVWAALDAYVKRATRKYNMDPVLENLSKQADNQPLENWNYIKKYADRINMRPTELDNLLDNTIKQVVGYRFGQRPTAYLTNKFRQAVYRGALGLNVGSALKNLSQGANTYAELGEQYTFKGYKDLLTKGVKELEDQGVLGQDMVQDRRIGVYKSLLQKMDSGLFALFDTAEKINRGSAYYGAKAKALAAGKSEEAAIQYAKDVVRKTQFTFGSIDTPVALSSDVAKLLAQFQTYGLKQAEFLGGKIKQKDILGLVRYTAATMLFAGTVGKLIGYRPEDIIPSLRFESPFTTALGATKDIGTLVFGSEEDKPQARKNLIKTGKLFVPAGVQLNKTYEGLRDTMRGYNTSTSGRIRYAVPSDPMSKVRGGLFGAYNFPQAKDYFNNGRTPLGDKQSEYVKSLDNPQQFINNYRSVQDQEKNLGITPGGGTGNPAVDLQRRQLKVKQAGGDNPFQNTNSIVKLVDGPVKQEKTGGFLGLFGGKKTEASETPSTPVDEYIQAYELDKYMGKAPTDPLKKITYESNKLSKAKSIYNDDGKKYPDNIKKALIEKMGYNVEDIRYDVAANLSTAERASYIADRMAAVKNDGQLKQFLEDTRTKSLSGKIMGTKSVYDLLIENGYMDEATKNYLLSFEKEIDSKTRKYTKKSTRKGKKPTKLTLPKVSPVKLTPIKLSNIKIPKSVSTKTQLKLPNKSRTLRIKV